MNSRERVMAVLSQQKPDRLPLMLHGFMPAAAEAGMSQAEFRSSAKSMSRAHLEFARKYGLDGVLMDVDTCMEAGAVGVPVDLPENEPARVTGPASDDIQRLMELMDPEALHKYDRIKVLLEAVELTKRDSRGEILVRGNCDQMAFSLAMLSYGMENFMADLLDEDMEASIFALMDRAYLVHLEFCRMMLEAGADIVSFGDSSCGPDLISRNMYLKYAYPYHCRLQKDIEAMNAKTVCHICGNLDLILEDVAGIGFAGVEIDYKTDVQRAAKLLKGKSAALGIIDPSGVFYFGNPETMIHEVNRTLECFGGENIVLGAGCAIPPGAPQENIFAFVKAARAY